MNSTDRLVTTELLSWLDADVSSNFNSSLFTSNNDDETPTL